MRSPAYEAILEKAEWSHHNRRSVFHIGEADVQRARLYAYGYRSQTIGSFHGCIEAIDRLSAESDNPHPDLGHAREALEELQRLGTIPVPSDFRALTFTLYTYDRLVVRALAALEKAANGGNLHGLDVLAGNFRSNLAGILGGNGIHSARDDVIPPDGSFLVPNLGIQIVPLIYGDRHSWNSAFLPGHCIGSTMHRHHEGVEIHLGYSPMYGDTMLGGSVTRLSEGYAMPIPVMADHGFDNLSADPHWVPFIFGSLTLGGWGVFFDVEPRPTKSEDLSPAPLDSKAMNYSRFIERDIAHAATQNGCFRNVLIPAAATASGKVGALELGINRIDQSGLDLTSESYRIFSVCAGTVDIEIGPERASLGPREHFGAPAGMTTRLTARGETPAVVLDAVIVPSPEGQS